MEYRIVIEEYAGQKMIHTYIVGELSEEQRNRIAAETIQTLNETHINKSLWDVREVQLRYSLTKIHMSVVNARASGLKDGNFVAVVYQNNKREYEHAKIVIRSLNINNLEYFQNTDEGVEWLASRG